MGEGFGKWSRRKGRAQQVLAYIIGCLKLPLQRFIGLEFKGAPD